MQQPQLEEIVRHLPIFPLPRTVLLPGSTLPLHVFEPRYRELVAHCLEGDGVMGIATLRPGYEANYDASPALYDCVGIGEVVAHQPFPDGRSNIALRYIGRAQIESELVTDHLFRVVQATLLEDDAEGVGPALRGLRVLVLQLGGLSTEASEEARRLVQLDGMDLADALARRLFENVEAQLSYLRSDRLVERVNLVQGELARFMAPTEPVGDA